MTEHPSTPGRAGAARYGLRLARAFGAGVLELVYPTHCAGCDEPGAVLCEACVAHIEATVPAHACPRCGAQVARGRPASRARGCGHCRGALTALDRVVALGPLEHPLSRAITLYKDAGERRLAAPLGELLARRVDAPGLVTWIPATRAAIARRGFDHAEMLAGAIAAALPGGTPCVSLLAPVRGRDQRGLSRLARRANVAGAFEARGSVSGEVLLVDDVLTTGATLDAAATTLRRAGAHRIDGCVLARQALLAERQRHRP